MCHTVRGPATVIAVLVLACFAASAPGQQTDRNSPTIEELGGERYRIGEVLIDRAAGSFTVSGRVLVLEPALEYLAVTVGGIKGYESLLELDADAYEFNLACILIGLSTDSVVPPDFQFDTDEVIGPRVRISVQWNEGDETVEHDASALLLSGGDAIPSGDWVYTGSIYVPAPEEPFLANQTGTLIGFVHDPASIIEHREGIGIGNYGAIGGNPDLLGAVGMELTLRVAVVGKDD